MAQAAEINTPVQGKASEALLLAFEPSSKQIQGLRTSITLRKVRSKPEIMICTADSGSGALLHNMLKKDILKNHCKLMMVKSGRDAWLQYLVQAPDIVFISLDMPDINGYMLARMIRTVDPKSFVVLLAPATPPGEAPPVYKDVQGVLEKPYPSAGVISLIQQFQQARQAKK